ncbi:MAG: hypothetical protein Q9227_000350 [Pyrenula ochraceoflavens]
MAGSGRLRPCWQAIVLYCILSLAKSQNVTSNGTNSGFNFVDPLIGTANGGHVFPGATLPFGMAKAVADVDGDNQGGFASDGSDVIGFSHMHDSGTGGDDVNQCKFPKLDRATAIINGTVSAHPGYFGVTLNTSVQAEMTVTNHTAIYRFTFPDQPIPPYAGNDSISLSPLILADLSDLPNSRINGSASVDPNTGRMTGTGTFEPSFGIGNYALYFCADFQGASIRDTGIFINNRAGSEPKNISVLYDGNNVSPNILPAGTWVRFQAPDSNNQMLARVGVSFISTGQACSNAEKEIPDFDFQGTQTAAENAWRDKLSVVSVDATGVDDSLQRTFWSGIYRSMISPQDYTGENPLWESDEPYYDSIWDSFRSIHSLITILDPLSQTLMMRSLIDIYRFEGKLPDCRMSLCKGQTQGGSNADVLLTDAYLKNITNGIDWATAYEAVVSDAEDEPANWAVEGRGGLTSWKTLGYIPTDDFDPYGVGLFTRSISRTVEYAYNDFCISTLASALGHSDDAVKYLARSGNWRNMYNPTQPAYLNTTYTGYTGFLQPLYLNSTFGHQPPLLCSPPQNFTSCYLSPSGHETYEGSPFLYTFFAPHDHASLIPLLGGPTAFVSRLSYLHAPDPGILYVGDEQAFLLTYQFHYAGRPGLSARQAHAYIPSSFNDSVAGIPGNDDSGAMGSFVALAMMGLFPNAGQDVYLITPPFFPAVSVTNWQTGNTARIRKIVLGAAGNGTGTGEADGGEGEGEGGEDNFYIQNATLNNEPYTKNWITHDFFLGGGELVLYVGGVESAWGTREEDLPPSASTGGANGTLTRARMGSSEEVGRRWMFEGGRWAVEGEGRG